MVSLVYKYIRSQSLHDWERGGVVTWGDPCCGGDSARVDRLLKVGFLVGKWWENAGKSQGNVETPAKMLGFLGIWRDVCVFFCF